MMSLKAAQSVDQQIKGVLIRQFILGENEASFFVQSLYMVGLTHIVFGRQKFSAFYFMEKPGVHHAWLSQFPCLLIAANASVILITSTVDSSG